MSTSFVQPNQNQVSTPSTTFDQRMTNILAENLKPLVYEANKKGKEKFKAAYQGHAADCRKTMPNAICHVKVYRAILDCYYRRVLLRLKQAKTGESTLEQCQRDFDAMRTQIASICKTGAGSQTSLNCGQQKQSKPMKKSAKTPPLSRQNPPEPDLKYPTHEEMTSLLRDCLTYYKGEYKYGIAQIQTALKANKASAAYQKELIKHKCAMEKICDIKSSECWTAFDIVAARNRNGIHLGGIFSKPNAALIFYKTWEERLGEFVWPLTEYKRYCQALNDS